MAVHFRPPGKALFTLLALLVGGPVFAHDGPPEPLILYERPGDPGAGRWMTTTFGLVQTLNGTDWDVMCAEAVGYDEFGDTWVLAQPGGALFVGSRLRGLFVSRDGGCSWASHPTFATRGTSDVQELPGRPSTVFVTTGKFNADNGLFRSDDDGVTFAQTLARADTFFTGIRFAPSDAKRVYVSAWSVSSGAGTLYRSDDGAASFMESSPAIPWGQAFTLLAVSPQSPDVLFATAFDESTSEYVLVRSVDAGASFSEVARDSNPFGQVAFSDDGGTVLASATRLFRSTDAGASFSKTLAPKRSPCVRARGGIIEACASPLLDQYALGRVVDDGSVSPTFSFNQVRGLLACPAGTQVHDTCSKIWPALAVVIGVPLRPDGGVDAGTSGGHDGGVGEEGRSEDPPGTAGCGCGAGGGGSLLALIGWFLLALRSKARARAGRILAAAALTVLLTACPTTPPDHPDGGETDVCSPNPCTTPGRTVCTEYEGRPVCAPDPDPCAPNPCTAPHQSVCSQVGDAAVCSCDPGYITDGSDGCRLDTPEDCSAQHASGDAFEPDECPALARDIGWSGAQQEAHTIDPATDADWFRVDGPEGRVFRLRASGDSALVADAWTGDPLTLVGSPHSSPEGVDAAWKLPAAGTLFFRIRAKDAMSVVPYVVNLSDVGVDDFGDDLASASSVTAMNGPIEGAIHYNGDNDVISVALTPGHSWEVSLSSPSPTQALTIERLEPSGSTRWSASGDPANTVTHVGDASPVLFRISAGPEVPGVGWSLNLTDLGADDRGDTAAEAEWMSTGSSRSGTIERAGDRDAFRYDAQAGHIYAVTCTSGGMQACALTLVDSNGAPIATGPDGLVLHEFAQSIEVVAFVESSSGEAFGYTLSVEDRGLDDHGDDPGTATDIGMPPVQGSANGMGVIETPGDHDFIAFTADADHVYRIRCTRGTLQDCNLRVFNSNGVVVVSDMNGGDAFTLHEYNGGGQFFIDISSVGAQVGTYSWLIEDLFHDDHGDDLFTATGMSANAAWVAGDLETPGDNDWFKLPLLTNHIYRFTCQRVSLQDCQLRLYDAAENLQAADIDGADAEILYKAGAAQTAHLRITAPGPQFGTYWIKAEDLGTDDCGDTVATAGTMLANGTPVTGVFEMPGDLDVRRLTLTAGTTYRLTASGTPTAFTLFAPDGTSVVASGGPPASFTPTLNGAHYLEVRAPGTLTGSYTIAVAP